jgi:hypothetical protein
MKRQDLDKGRQICSDAELLAGDRHGEISAKRSPQLEPDGVGCRTIKYPDPQAVLEPAKEQFDLPAVTIQLGDDSVSPAGLNAATMGGVKCSHPEWVGWS